MVYSRPSHNFKLYQDGPTSRHNERLIYKLCADHDWSHQWYSCCDWKNSQHHNTSRGQPGWYCHLGFASGVKKSSPVCLCKSIWCEYHAGIEFLFIIDHSSVPSQSYETIVVSQMLSVYPDPLASESPLIQQGRNISTFCVIMPYDFSESKMLQDYRSKSVLQGFSQVGGLWTFLMGIFVAIFGSTILQIVFGSISGSLLF